MSNEFPPNTTPQVSSCKKRGFLWRLCFLLVTPVFFVLWLPCVILTPLLTIIAYPIMYLFDINRSWYVHYACRILDALNWWCKFA